MGYDPSNPNFRVETIKGDFLNSPQNPSAIFDFYTATDVKYKNITFLRKIVNIAIQILISQSYCMDFPGIWLLSSQALKT